MPWKVSEVVNERVNFVARLEQDSLTSPGVPRADV